MGIKEFLQKRIEKNNMLKERHNELRVEKMANDRMESPEERDIKKWIEKKRQESLREELKAINATETRGFFSQGILSKENMFKEKGQSILTFENNQMGGGMFFKWKRN